MIFMEFTNHFDFQMSVESSSRELFHLINLASFDKGHSVQSAAFTESRNFIYGLLISSNKKLNFCHIPKHRKEDKLKGENLLPSHKSTFDNKGIFSNRDEAGR